MTEFIYASRLSTVYQVPGHTIHNIISVIKQLTQFKTVIKYDKIDSKRFNNIHSFDLVVKWMYVDGGKELMALL